MFYLGLNMSPLSDSLLMLMFFHHLKNVLYKNTAGRLFDCFLYWEKNSSSQFVFAVCE